MRNLLLTCCLLTGILAAGAVHAEEATTPIGRIDILTGPMQAIRNGEALALNVGDMVFEGDELSTSASSIAKITLSGDENNNINLGKNARLKLTSYKVSESGDMLGGHFEAVSGFYTMSLSRLTEGAEFSFGTDVATLNVIGTSWAIDTAGNMVCTSGQLVITHAATGKKYTVNAGQMFSLRGFQDNPVVSAASEAIMNNVETATQRYYALNESTKNVLHNRLGGEADGRVSEMSVDLQTGNIYGNSEFESSMEFAGTAIYAVGEQFKPNSPVGGSTTTVPFAPTPPPGAGSGSGKNASDS